MRRLLCWLFGHKVETHSFWAFTGGLDPTVVTYRECTRCGKEL
jgi:hypothetical protein